MIERNARLEASAPGVVFTPAVAHAPGARESDFQYGRRAKVRYATRIERQILIDGSTLMKLMRLGLALVALSSLASLAYVAQQAEPSGTSMVMAAQSFLGGARRQPKANRDLPI